MASTEYRRDTMKRIEPMYLAVILITILTILLIELTILVHLYINDILSFDQAFSSYVIISVNIVIIGIVYPIITNLPNDKESNHDI